MGDVKPSASSRLRPSVTEARICSLILVKFSCVWHLEKLLSHTSEMEASVLLALGLQEIGQLGKM
jgi:hypothetical protein